MNNTIDLPPFYIRGSDLVLNTWEKINYGLSLLRQHTDLQCIPKDVLPGDEIIPFLHSIMSWFDSLEIEGIQVLSEEDLKYGNRFFSVWDNNLNILLKEK